MPTFSDRHQAGNVLAKRLGSYVGRSDVVVLGLPRGGIQVAAAVARELDAALDVVVVRTLALPGFEDVAMGAIGPSGITLIDWGTVARFDVSGSAVATVLARERAELHRQEAAYRGEAPAVVLTERTVILVDDGFASGTEMRAAISSARARHAARIVVAVPIYAPTTCTELLHEVDEIAYALTPEPLHAMAQSYRDTALPSDDDVRRLLAESRHPSTAKLPSESAAPTL